MQPSEREKTEKNCTQQIRKTDNRQIIQMLNEFERANIFPSINYIVSAIGAFISALVAVVFFFLSHMKLHTLYRPDVLSAIGFERALKKISFAIKMLLDGCVCTRVVLFSVTRFKCSMATHQ